MLRIERFILFPEIFPMEDIFCCLLRSHSLKSFLLIDLDLVQAALCPEIPLPVIYQRVV